MNKEYWDAIEKDAENIAKSLEQSAINIRKIIGKCRDWQDPSLLFAIIDEGEKPRNLSCIYQAVFNAKNEK